MHYVATLEDLENIAFMVLELFQVFTFKLNEKQ